MQVKAQVGSKMAKKVGKALKPAQTLNCAWLLKERLEDSNQ